MKYDPIKELNDEQEASLLNPFKVILWSMILGPLGIAIFVKYEIAIDTFAFRHPVVMGVLMISVSVTGLVLIVRKMMW